MIRISIVEDICKPIIWVPDAFVPEGVNKTFAPVVTNVKLIKIFNRWGEMLFEGSGKSIEWNGNYKEGLCPDGLYVYTIRYVGYNGKEYSTKGVISLLR